MARLPSLFILLASALLATEARATDTRHAPVSAPRQFRRDLTTCEQTYGLGWARCGAGDSTFCYNPSQGHVGCPSPLSHRPFCTPADFIPPKQVCCTEDSGYCERGQYCGPVAGYCCVEGEDFGTCADANGFPLPTTIDATWTTTWTRTTTVTIPRSTKEATVHAAATRGAMRRGTTIIVTLTTTATDCIASEATIESVATMTGMFLVGGGGSGGGESISGLNSTTAQVTGLSANSSMTTPRTTSRMGTPLGSPLPTPSAVQVSDARKEQGTLLWMALAIGFVGVFMISC